MVTLKARHCSNTYHIGYRAIVQVYVAQKTVQFPLTPKVCFFYPNIGQFFAVNFIEKTKGLVVPLGKDKYRLVEL